MQMSIYNKKYWHALSPSLHFVRHEGRLVPGAGEGGGEESVYESGGDARRLA